MSNLVPISDIKSMAIAFAASRMFGVKSPEEAMALMLIAQAEGSHPAIALRDYHIINGRPSLKADAMMARFQAAGGKVVWEKIEDTEVIGVFSHPQGGEARISWDDKRVIQAQLKKDNHLKYPRQMKRARVISEGIRTVYPAVICGFYTPEEVEEFEPIKDGKVNIEGSVKKPDFSMTDPDAPKAPSSEERRAWGKDIIAKVSEVASDDALDVLLLEFDAKIKQLSVQGQDAVNKEVEVARARILANKEIE